MSLYSTLVSFLPLLTIIMALWFLYNVFLIPQKVETGDTNAMELFLPIFVLAIVVVLLIITNMYGV